MCVSGWLDDIGLPQYKSPFDEARVDGCMLHYMTVVSGEPSEAALPLRLLCFPISSLNVPDSRFAGRPAVSEGGQRAPSPQHQEGRSGPPPQLLRTQLSAATAL